VGSDLDNWFVRLSKVIQLAVAMRYYGLSALLVGLFLALGSVLIAVDLLQVYLSLLPFQGLWGALDTMDKLRLILLPAFVCLSGWYLVGAFKYRTILLVH